MFKKIAYGLLTLLGLILTLGSKDAYKTTLIKEDAAANGQITIVLVNWDSEIASSNVLAETFKRAGFDANVVSVENTIMRESLANGEADASVSAWLPVSHAAQYEQYKDRIDFVRTNLDDARTGLVVPAYMAVDSVEDLTDEANNTITGIEPGANAVNIAEGLIADYDNLDEGWHVATSSTGAMSAQLGQAFNKHEEITVTGWNPHWMFQKYDLKFLDDPQGHFGSENVYTMARQGLKEDNPQAYSILQNFHWRIENSEEVMLKIHDGAPAEEAADEFLDDHPELYAEWTKDL